MLNYSFLNSRFRAFPDKNKGNQFLHVLLTFGGVAAHFMIFTLSFALEINVQTSLGTLPPHHAKISCRIS